MKASHIEPARVPSAPAGLSRPQHTHHEIDLLAKDLWKAMQSGDGEKVYTDARRFYRRLAEHIRDEDSAEGWYTEVERLAPKMIHRLERLRVHHQGILANLRLIIAEVDDDLEGVRALVDETLDMVTQHEDEEAQLIEDVYDVAGI